MQIQLRFFAGLRETFGVSSESITLPDSTRTAEDVLAALRLRGEAWADALADVSAFRVAVDQRLGSPASLVQHGAEVAFFPPITGG